MVLRYKMQYKYQNEDTQSPYCGNAAKCQNVLDTTHTHTSENEQCIQHNNGTINQQYPPTFGGLIELKKRKITNLFLWFNKDE